MVNTWNVIKDVGKIAQAVADPFNSDLIINTAISQRGGSPGGAPAPAAPAAPAAPLAPWQLPSSFGIPGSNGTGASADLTRWSSLYGIDQNLAQAVVRTRTAGEGNIGAVIDNYYREAQQDPAGFENLQRSLYRAGFFGNAKPGDFTWGLMDAVTLSGLTRALTTAAQYNGLPGNTTTFEDVLEQSETARAGMGGGGPQTATTTRIAQTSELDAASTLRDAMTRLLGRSPTAGEVNDFHSTLNSAERRTPIVTTTTTDDQGNTTEQSSGGLNAGGVDELTRQRINKEHGVERNQYGVMSYMQAFERAISGGVGG